MMRIPKQVVGPVRIDLSGDECSPQQGAFHFRTATEEAGDLGSRDPTVLIRRVVFNDVLEERFYDRRRIDLVLVRFPIRVVRVWRQQAFAGMGKGRMAYIVEQGSKANQPLLPLESARVVTQLTLQVIPSPGRRRVVHQCGDVHDAKRMLESGV